MAMREHTNDNGIAAGNSYAPFSGSICFWFIIKGQKRKRNGVIALTAPAGLDREGVEDWLTTTGTTYGTQGDGKSYVSRICEPSPLEQWMEEQGIEALEDWGLKTN
jgi:hypothetical protein